MSEAKRLLEQATPLPWRQVGIRDENDVLAGAVFDDHPDGALILFAVNRLPDYEAAVEALERFVESHDAGYPASLVLSEEACDAARAALVHLRESEAASVR